MTSQRACSSRHRVRAAQGVSQRNTGGAWGLASHWPAAPHLKYLFSSHAHRATCCDCSSFRLAVRAWGAGEGPSVGPPAW